MGTLILIYALASCALRWRGHIPLPHPPPWATKAAHYFNFSMFLPPKCLCQIKPCSYISNSYYYYVWWNCIEVNKPVSNLVGARLLHSGEFYWKWIMELVNHSYQSVNSIRTKHINRQQCHTQQPLNPCYSYSLCKTSLWCMTAVWRWWTTALWIPLEDKVHFMS